MKFEITVFGVVLPSPNEWRGVAIAKCTKRAEEPRHNTICHGRCRRWVCKQAQVLLEMYDADQRWLEQRVNCTNGLLSFAILNFDVYSPTRSSVLTNVQLPLFCLRSIGFWSIGL
ncbi:hypothetical protein L1887_20826 [Cichorium endivia]|nr:hypothetical protein L1887_20826 [Cichorium endivia]